MPTVLVSNDDLTVLGSPEIVELLVDIGPTGTRGSQFFVGIGNPNTPGVLTQTALLNDLYINISPGSEYGYLYQYVSQPGSNTWTRVLSLNPNIYSKKHLATFSSGQATISIPIVNITSIAAASLVANNFTINYSIGNSNPIASSISSFTINGSNLDIVIKGIEYSGGSWSALNTEQTIHFIISTTVI